MCLTKDGGLLAALGPGAAEEDPRLRQVRPRTIFTCYISNIKVKK